MVELPDQDVEKAAALFAVEASKSGLAPEAGKKADGAKQPPSRIRFVGEAEVQLVVDAASPRLTQGETLTVAAPAAAPATDMEVASARCVPSRHLAVPIGVAPHAAGARSSRKAADAVLSHCIPEERLIPRACCGRQMCAPCAPKACEPRCRSVKKMALLHVLLERVQRVWVPVEGKR